MTCTNSHFVILFEPQNHYGHKGDVRIGYQNIYSLSATDATQ